MSHVSRLATGFLLLQSVNQLDSREAANASMLVHNRLSADGCSEMGCTRSRSAD